MEDDLNTIAILSDAQEEFKVKLKNGNKFILKVSADWYKNGDIITCDFPELKYKIIDRWYHKVFRFFRIQKYRKMIEI